MLRRAVRGHAGHFADRGAFQEATEYIWPVAAVRDASGRAARTLTDEQETVSKRPSYRNSMYLDAVVPQAYRYEFAHEFTAHENTHPPLGKIFIMWTLVCLT